MISESGEEIRVSGDLFSLISTQIFRDGRVQHNGHVNFTALLSSNFCRLKKRARQDSNLRPTDSKSSGWIPFEPKMAGD